MYVGSKSSVKQFLRVMLDRSTKNQRIPRILKIVTYDFGRSVFFLSDTAIWYNHDNKFLFNTKISFCQKSLFTFWVRNAFQSFSLN